VRYLLTLIVGLLLGGALAFYFLVGTPRARNLPGIPVRAPDQAGDPPGTTIIQLDEKFFDAVFGAMFRDLPPPTFPLQSVGFGALAPNGEAPIQNAVFQGDCPSQVVLLPEGSGFVSGVRFIEGNIVTPLAFTGSYNAPIFGCLRFKGWARANLQLSFDQPKQTLFGRINVEGVNLEGVQPQANGIVTSLVQNAINQRVNPIVVLRQEQLTLAIPIQASNGVLKGQARDVRAETGNGTMRLHITYDFSGERKQ
jgi:hypothetical protein